MALRFIGAPRLPAVIGLELPAFDTHNRQLPRHARQLAMLGEALACFDQGLRQLHHRPEVLLVAVSEFGRSLEQNASGGTDHGSVSVAIMLGDDVQPFLGEYPSLTDLDERGDLKPAILPSQLYQRVFPTSSHLPPCLGGGIHLVGYVVGTLDSQVAPRPTGVFQPRSDHVSRGC
jgi:uncharacterized protein (DUF1501 family)